MNTTTMTMANSTAKTGPNGSNGFSNQNIDITQVEGAGVKLNEADRDPNVYVAEIQESQVNKANTNDPSLINQAE